MIISSQIIDEVVAVLRRPKFASYVSDERLTIFVARLIHSAALHEPSVTVRECRDPKDDKILSLAVSSAASCIVASDDDLLVMPPFRGIPVLTPRRFVDTWRGPGDAP